MENEGTFGNDCWVQGVGSEESIVSSCVKVLSTGFCLQESRW